MNHREINMKGCYKKLSYLRIKNKYSYDDMAKKIANIFNLKPDDIFYET